MKNPDSWGEPPLNDIGIGFTLLAQALEASPERRALLRAQMQHLDNVFPRGAWGYDLLMQADRAAWPAWTAECLPCLWIDRDDSVIVWMGMAGESFAKEFYQDVEAQYLGNRFLQISKANPILKSIENTVAEIEVAISERPTMRENEYLAQDRHMFQECDAAIRSWNSRATIVAQVRQSFHRIITTP